MGIEKTISPSGTSELRVILKRSWLSITPKCVADRLSPSPSPRLPKSFVSFLSSSSQTSPGKPSSASLPPSSAWTEFISLCSNVDIVEAKRLMFTGVSLHQTMSSRWAKYYALFIFVSPYLTLYQLSMFSSFAYAFLCMQPMSQVKKKTLVSYTIVELYFTT